MTRPLLELSQITRCFLSGEHETTVLKNIDLTIYAGEMVAIIGASGSGKSTLMNILGCLDRPTKGSYSIDGREVKDLYSDELARLRREHFGFIFQKYHLMTHLNAIQNAEIPAIYSGMSKSGRKERARQLLSRLGLEDRCYYRPGQLSGGQQQRVSVARALMNGGNVILADEPTGALDSKSGQEMLKILHELNDIGHTIILVTHDMQVANSAKRIIEIRDGEILKDYPNANFIDNQIEGITKEELEKLQDQELEAQNQSEILPQKTTWQAHWGRFAEAFNMAIVAMASHRMRTLLTMLGIIIGIMSVVSVVALGQGARQKVINDISSMGTNVISIYPGEDFGDEDAATIQTLVPSDLEVLQSQVYVDSATPGTGTSRLLRYRNIKADASVSGVGDQYFRVRGFEIDKGILFDQQDIKIHAQVVVIDPNTCKKLFASHEEPIGKIIFVGSLPCQVIGVTKEKESPFGNNQNLEVWMPYTSAMSRLLGQQHFNSITVRVKDGMSNPIAEQSIIKLLKQRHGTKDFFTNSSDTILKTVEKTTATLTIMISAIAVISLLVGGIGVMNIMLVSVSERTHEIGIRMAIGARQSDILQQFLIESILVCLLGGVIGILMSYAIAMIFPFFVTAITMKFSAASIIYAVLCSSLIGVLFGFLPARSAAQLDPIEALARE